MSDVFISYSRKDIAFARLLQESLADSQIDTWIDWERIPIGEKWWDEITHAIENANVFMLIISKNSIGSIVCKDEINLALKNNKRIIPIVVDRLDEKDIHSFAPELPQFNWIVFEQDNLFQLREEPNLPGTNPEDRQVAMARLPQFQEALTRLSQAIHTDWDWVRTHTRLQVQALLWVKNYRDAGYLLGGSALEDAESQLFRASGRQPMPTDLQVDYVTVSRKTETDRQQEKLRLEKKASQRQRVAIFSILVGLLLALVLGGLAWGQRNQYLAETIVRATAQAMAVEQQGIAENQRQVAEEQRDIAEDQRNQVISRQLASQGLIESTRQFDLALLLGLEADRRSNGENWSRAFLFEILQTSPRLSAYMRGHSDDVTSLAVSPQGKLIISAGLDGTFRFWDVTNPAEPKPINSKATPAHVGGVTSIALNPQGSLLASAGKDGMIRMWDVTNPTAPQPVGEAFTDHTGEVTSVVFSPNGSQLASAGADGAILLWDVTDPQRPQIIGDRLSWILGAVLNLKFSPDGNLLAPISFNKFVTSIYLWDITDPLNPVAYPNKESSQTEAIAFHPTLPYLAVGNLNGAVTFWDRTNPGSLVKIGSIPSNSFIQITSLLFNPAGTHLAVADSEKMIHLWDITNPENPKKIGASLLGHTSRITSLAYLPSGTILLSGGWDDTILLWDLADENLPKFFGQRSPTLDVVTSVDFLPSGNTFFAGIEADQVQVESVTEWLTNELLETGLNVKKYGGLVAWNKTDAGTMEQILQMVGPDMGNITAMAMSPQASVLAVATSDKQIRFWDVSDPAKPMLLGQPLLGHSRYVRDLVISPNGARLASATWEGEVILWDISKPESFRPLANNFRGISVAFSVDSKMLAVAGYNNSIEFWDCSGTTLPKRISTFISPVKMDVAKMVFTPNGQVLIVGGLDGLVRILDVTKPSSVSQVGKPITAHNSAIHGLAISPNGQYFATGSVDEEIALWDISDPANPLSYGLPLKGHQASVYSLAFSPDGSLLASGSADASVILWNVDWNILPGYACKLAGRNLTKQEWQQFMPTGEAYKKTCVDLP